MLAYQIRKPVTEMTDRWIKVCYYGHVREHRYISGDIVCRVRPARDDGTKWYYLVLTKGIVTASGRGNTLADCKEQCQSYVDAVKHGLYDQD